jgi:hypothetical protein
MSQEQHQQQHQQWWQLEDEPTQAPGWTRLYEPELNKDMNMGLKLNDLLDSKFLKKEDLGDDEHLVTIKKVAKTNVARDDEPPKYKGTIQFDEFPKPMVANTTNLNRIAKAFGNDTDSWIGQQIKVFYDPDVEFGGKITGGIRVRVPSPRSRSGGGDDDVNRKLRESQDDSDSIPF